MSSSLTASQQALDDLVDPARIRKHWNKHDARWAEAAELSLKTLQRFWARKPIRRANFIALCQAIDIEDWKAITDPSSYSLESKQLNDKSATIASLQPLSVPQEVELKTERNIDYTKLRDLLMAEKWQKANYETQKVMWKAAGQESGLTIESIEQFPCNDLQTIDQLWLKYSNGRFGFSVQKHIYQEVGEDYIRLGDYVGWRKDGKWLADMELLSGPSGSRVKAV